MTDLSTLHGSPSALYLVGDVRERLAGLADDSVDLVLSSPPFLALRSYLPADHPDKPLEIGSEPTPGEFIDTLLDVVEECERVLAPHGTLAFELGDTYSGSGGAGGDYSEGGLREGQPAFRQGYVRNDRPNRPPQQAPKAYGNGGPRPARTGRCDDWPEAKSLCLIPEIFRFSLVYGFNPLTGRTTPRWRARNVVRWCRPNPPVGALGDKFRPGTSDMVIVCKAKDRYFDLDAVRGPPSANTHARLARGLDVAERSGKSADRDGNWNSLAEMNETAGAPPLDWWKISTQSYEGSHYATFPTELCVRPIAAMCPQRVCLTCGQPSRRIVEAGGDYADRLGASIFHTDRMITGKHSGQPKGGHIQSAEYVTLGWTDCDCMEALGSLEGSKWRPGIVLDPFAGSGTTLEVAVGHGRSAIGIDLDERNAELARDRVGPLFFAIDTDRPARATETVAAGAVL